MVNVSYILFDPDNINNFLPLAYTKALADFRIGIFTLVEKWKLHLGKTAQVLTRDFLQKKYPLNFKSLNNIYINSAFLPDHKLVEAINLLQDKEALWAGNQIVAFRSEFDFFLSLESLKQAIDTSVTVKYVLNCTSINHNWDIFIINGNQIKSDIQFISKILANRNLNNALSVKNGQEIFVDEGVSIESCILNATDGPIYIGKHASVLDGAILKGPISIGEHAVVKAGAKIYGDTTIGPYCKVGGEISNSVLFSYSNKSHDGYLGNSVIGEWCNLGADTNTSNLKNNYSLVKSWDYSKEEFIDTGLQFCGLVMGDHSKCGINTMFNTGTVVGVAANIYGSDFPPKFIPSFSWGGSNGLTTFKLAKAYEMAINMMRRKNIVLEEINRSILEYVYHQDLKYRVNIKLES